MPALNNVRDNNEKWARLIEKYVHTSFIKRVHNTFHFKILIFITLKLPWNTPILQYGSYDIIPYSFSLQFSIWCLGGKSNHIKKKLKIILLFRGTCTFNLLRWTFGELAYLVRFQTRFEGNKGIYNEKCPVEVNEWKVKGKWWCSSSSRIKSLLRIHFLIKKVNR